MQYAFCIIFKLMQDNEKQEPRNSLHTGLVYESSGYIELSDWLCAKTITLGVPT